MTCDNLSLATFQPSLPKVTVQKNRISTESKVQQLQEMKTEVKSLLGECLVILRNEKLVPDNAEHVESKTLVLATEELTSSPLLTMKLRYAVAMELFCPSGSESESNESSLMELIHADPFLGCLDDIIKQPQAMRSVDDVVAARESWVDELKTDTWPELLVIDSCSISTFGTFVF